MLRSSGLYQTRGSTVSIGPVGDPIRASTSYRRDCALTSPIRVANDGRGRVRVVAVHDELDGRAPSGGHIGSEPAGNDEHGPDVVAIEQVVDGRGLGASPTRSK